MNFSLLRRCSAVAVVCAFSLFAQSKIDLKNQGKNIDFSSSGPTKPAQIGTALPATCGQGEFFFLTSAPAGQNVYGCSAANTWTLEGAAIPEASLLPSELNNSGALLSNDGTNPHWQPIGGDVSGTVNALHVIGLNGRGLSSSAPGNGSLLQFNSSTGLWQPINLGGDLTGTPAALTVAAVQGHPVATTNPIDGQVMRWNLSKNWWEPVSLAGDISGNAGAVTVMGLQGHAVSTGAPSTGQILSWTSGNLWAPVTFAGDVSGAPGSMTVSALQGRSVSNSAPASGQILSWVSGANVWSPTAFGGDVNGAPGSMKVAGLQGRAISTAAPNDGQLLKYNVANAWWEPITLGGDVSGAPAALKVAGLQGRAVSAATPSTGQVLTWSTANNAWQPATFTPPPNFNATFASSSTVSILGTQHNFGTPNLIVTCYDANTPANLIEPSNVTVDPNSYNVNVTFAQPQTGRCVINGSGGMGQVVQGGGSGGGASLASQLSDLSAAMTSSTVLTIGASCSTLTPCNVRFGTATYSVINSSTVTVSGGSGTIYVYMTQDGTLNVGQNGLTLACSSGCAVQSNITAFPANSIPIFTWNTANGAFIANGGNDQRAFQSTKIIVAGTGVTATDSGAMTTIAMDSSVVPTYLTATAALAFGAINNASCAAPQSIPLPGAIVGNGVAAGWPGLPAGVIGMMQVNSANTVSVTICNLSGSATTLSSLSYTATVVRGS